MLTGKQTSQTHTTLELSCAAYSNNPQIRQDETRRERKRERSAYHTTSTPHRHHTRHYTKSPTPTPVTQEVTLSTPHQHPSLCRTLHACMHAVVSESAACMSEDQTTTISLFHVAACFHSAQRFFCMNCVPRAVIFPILLLPLFGLGLGFRVFLAGGGGVGTGKWLFSLILSHL